MARPLVALEEHYYSTAIYNTIGEKLQNAMKAVKGLTDEVREVGDARLAAMNRGRIALQVVSHSFTPGGPSAENCRAGNDELARAIAKNRQPTRFAAFAVLAVSDPIASARELERTVTQHGFVGALIDNNANGKHFDSPEYDVLWAKASELDVPIYLHPTWPSPEQRDNFKGAYSEIVTTSLGGPGWGWHSDVGLHVLKLFSSGVFDRFPTLKIVIGHMGEMLPYMLERCCDMSANFGGGWGAHDRPLRQVWDENIWITTSGTWSLSPFKCLLDNTKIERIMYGVDYPHETNEKGLAWFEALEASGLLTPEQLDLVAFGNAENLLGLRAKRDFLP